uniref:EF-hand domain-containing protein n=1 Tax=Ditylenchus dipsaci TaxID=166011 RepID=A0A915CL50_9BILA
MKPNTQVRHSLLFLFEWGKSAEEACKAIQQTYGVDSISRVACAQWFQRFRTGDTSLQDKEDKVGKEDPPKILGDTKPKIGTVLMEAMKLWLQKNRVNGTHEALATKKSNIASAAESKPKAVDRVNGTHEALATKKSNNTALAESKPKAVDRVNGIHETVPISDQEVGTHFTTFFDRNHSRQMDWGDFYLVVRRIRDVYGAESVAYAYARKSMEALWQGLCKLADSDDDNLISMEEWVDLLKKIEVKHQSEPKWFNEYQNFMFKLFDVSGDGVVDLIEYVDGMSIYGYTYQECVEAWKAFAIDSKGNALPNIGPEQWKKMFLDLFFSVDKTLPGNNLFGILKSS